jgi:hypothetical protein
MMSFVELQSMLQRAQAAVVALETGRTAVTPYTVPPAVSALVCELGIVSSELQSEVALLGTLLQETEALIARCKAVKGASAGEHHA